MDGLRIKIDTSAWPRVANALNKCGDEMATKVVYLALNRTGDSTFTLLKRMIAEKSGRKIGYVAGRIEKKVAYAGNLRYEMVVRDWWAKISSPEFKAYEVETGVVHTAWQGKLAKRAFMLAEGAFKRLASDRVKPLFGPNVAREVIRAEKEVDELLRAQANSVFVPRVMHELQRAIAREKAANKL